MALPLKTPRRDHVASLARSEQFLDRMRAVVDDRERTSLRPGELGFQIDAEAMEDGGDDLGRVHGAFGRVAARFVGAADDAAPLDAAASEHDGPALRPVIAPAGRVDFRRA